MVPMMRLLITLGVMLVNLSVNQVRASHLTTPPVVSSGVDKPSSWEITITCREHFVDTDDISFWTRAFCWGVNGEKCDMVGPTIEVFPGDELQLTLINELGPNSDDPVVWNTMHSPNSTNVHTHGLHISPRVDTIFVQAEPGETIVYNYKIPENHAPGIHWYHDHVHGAATLKMMGGAVGAFIVRPLPEQNIPTSITDNPEFPVVVTWMRANQAVDSNGRVSQDCAFAVECDPGTQPPGCTESNKEDSKYLETYRIYSYHELSAATGSLMDPIVNVKADSAPDNLLFLNGQLRPQMNVSVGGASTLRFIAAHGQSTIRIELSSYTVCKMVVIAFDGVYLRARKEMETIQMLSGGRVDVQVECTAETSVEMLFNAETVLYIDAIATQTEEETLLTVTDDQLAAIVRPYYMQDLSGLSSDEVDVYYHQHMSQGGRPRIEDCQDANQFWTGAGPDCTGISPWGSVEGSEDNENCPFQFFLGPRGEDPSVFHDLKKLVTAVGEINEWHIFGAEGDESHPFHLHSHHVQIIGFDCLNGNCYSPNRVNNWEDWMGVGEWRDTIPTFVGRTRVRFRPVDYPGETMAHCHFLRHEDLGMMESVLVVDCENNTLDQTCGSPCYRNSSMCREDGSLWSEEPLNVTATDTIEATNTLDMLDVTDVVTSVDGITEAESMATMKTTVPPASTISASGNARATMNTTTNTSSKDSTTSTLILTSASASRPTIALICATILLICIHDP